MNEQIAQALGWTRQHGMWCGTDGQPLTIDYLGLIGHMPDFTKEREFIYILEDDIEARGLWESFMFELYTILSQNAEEWARMPTGRKTWLALRATPEQRSRAYLKARGLL